MNKVLITGASGFLGRACIKFLYDQNFEIHAISRKKILDKKIIWHQKNLLDSKSNYELIKSIKPSYLLHCAWTTEHGKFWSSNDNLLWLNSSLELLRYFIDFGGKRSVLVGSCAEYDLTYTKCTENKTPLHPSTLYGYCKNSLQNISQIYSKKFNLSLAWARLFYLFGPYENELKFISSVIISLINDKVTVCNNSNLKRDFLFIEDAASAIVKLLFSNIEGPINIASGKKISLGSITKKIASYLNKKELIRLKNIDETDEISLIVANVDRLNKDLKWNSQFTFEQRLFETIEWWKKNKS